MQVTHQPIETLDSQPAPEDKEKPVAVVRGQAITELPADLYIPPDALEIFLETFEGPLDLLLYLIKKQNLDILDIPVAEITRQYMKYVEMMEQFRLELAAEYLVMAAMLAEIKSRMLLPRPVEAEPEEDDPRVELVRRLQEYERFKQAAEHLDELPRLHRDIFLTTVEPPFVEKPTVFPQADLNDLLFALKDVLKRAELYQHHHVGREALSIRERMSAILSAISPDSFTEFTCLFTLTEGRIGVVVTFIAILELLKQSMIEIVQTETYGPIHIKAK